MSVFAVHSWWGWIPILVLGVTFLIILVIVGYCSFRAESWSGSGRSRRIDDEFDQQDTRNGRYGGW